MDAESDGVPELLEEQRTRKTLEFCNDAHERFRCTRGKDHDGPHECVGLDGTRKW